jgi:hypothetical protein
MIHSVADLLVWTAWHTSNTHIRDSTTLISDRREYSVRLFSLYIAGAALCPIRARKPPPRGSYCITRSQPSTRDTHPTTRTHTPKPNPRSCLVSLHPHSSSNSRAAAHSSPRRRSRSYSPALTGSTAACVLVSTPPDHLLPYFSPLAWIPATGAALASAYRPTSGAIPIPCIGRGWRRRSE